MAVVDHNYQFIYADVGSEGRASDGGIWKKCTLFADLQDPANPLNIPDPAPMVGYDGNLPFFLVGDDAFKMSTGLMKPYSQSKLSKKQRIYNYRISRARHIVENAFGIMSSKFRVFLKQIDLSPNNVDNAILAGVVLHNFCRQKCGVNYLQPQSLDVEDDDHNIVAGTWRNEAGLLESVHGTRGMNASWAAKGMRDKLANFFLTPEGEVSWQYRLALADQ